ncbi:TonB-dependent receptor [Niabella defluvii]|nr:TonB-dependent receptor [Niabella sp. I65]
MPFVDNLKIRGSWGQMGAEPYFGGNLAEYQFISSYPFINYVLNDAVVQALYETRVANQNFTWEIGNNTNIGLDVSFLNNRLAVELDYFYNIRERALIAETGLVPQSSGIANKLPPTNKGKMSNRGGEFKVSWSDNVGDISYNLSVNGGYAKTKCFIPASRPVYPSGSAPPANPTEPAVIR